MKAPRATLQATDSGYTLEGVLDHETAPALFRQSLSSESEHLRLNVSALEKVDSAGIALLLHWTQMLHTQQQQLLIEQADPQLMQMVAILAVDSQLNFT